MARNCTNCGGDNGWLPGGLVAWVPVLDPPALPELATSGWTRLVLSSLEHQTNMIEARRAPLGGSHSPFD